MASTIKLDAIQLEILRARVGEIIETARHLLFHSGYSTILRETQDGSVTLCGLDGTVIHSGGGPLQTFGYMRTVQGVLKFHPVETMNDGDCYISSDPYQGGMLHVPDVAIVTPIFIDGKAIGFVVSHAHKPDFGGLVPGSSGAGSREIFHDGLLLPGVLYWTKDGVNKDMEAIIKANCRIPEVIEGDLRAQVGCTLVGVESVKKLCAEFGTDVVTSAFAEFLERSAQRIRDGLQTWPDGESEAECWIDLDGVDIDKPLRLHVKVIKKGDHITFDYSVSAHLVKGP
jgi:N-methylhydantoinase B